MKGSAPIRTLLVDDNVTFREDFRVFAEELPGVEIVGEAGNGTTAIKQAVVLQPDLVLMDFALPGMNGMEALQRIQQTHSARRVIIVTAHESTELRNMCRVRGADGFISKFALCEQLPQLLAKLFTFDAPAAKPSLESTFSRVDRVAPAPHVRRAAPRSDPARTSEEPRPLNHR
jgi:DNA-binding NarL/FixJ family response regulator